VELGVAPEVGFAPVQKLFPNGCLFQDLRVDTPAVVLQGEHYLAAVVPGAKQQRSRLCLA
jgi:hypothetical protein